MRALRLAVAIAWLLSATSAFAQTAQERLQQRENELLSFPVSQDSAAEMAFLHHPTITRGLAMLGIDEAKRLAAVHGPPQTRVRGLDPETRIERAITNNVLDWLMQAVLAANPALASTHVRVGTAEEIGVTLFTARRALISALAAAQEADLQDRLVAALQATHDLAQQMRRVGNASHLDAMRAERSLAEAAARRTAARALAALERERLAHAMGLWGQDIERMQLPPRFPALPGSVVGAEGMEARAVAWRWDMRRLRVSIEASNAATLSVDTSAHEADHGPLTAQLDEMAVRARAEVRTAWISYRAAFDLARHGRDQLVPIAKRISEEMLLRYNGMLVSVSALLVDAAEQATAVVQALRAERDFWLAEIDLQQALAGIGILHAGVFLKGQVRDSDSHHGTH
ncbi:MAG: TolC family protein [Betaproteobacteria bacterium]|nr:TolC family protein [Betaproteobacteria bacterium]